MSASEDASYFSRFLLKFVDIIAAGLATAVSGYLIAHLTGVLSSPAPSPAPAAMQGAPSALAPAPVQAVSPSTDATSNSPSQVTAASPQVNAPSAQVNAPSAQANAPSPQVNAPSASVIEQPPSRQQEVNAPPPSKPGRRTANSAKAEPGRKEVENSAAVSTHARESFVSRIRGALTNVDAKPKDPVAPPRE